MIPTVFPTAKTLDVARLLLDRHPRLAARDALQEIGLAGICTYDRDFDQIRSFKRLEASQIP